MLKTVNPAQVEAVNNNTTQVALSVVVPCYNEEENIAELYSRTFKACHSIVRDDFEIVVVDDGSTDRTRTLIEDLCDKAGAITGVFLARNHGHQLALTAGLKFCKGERILILDSDLQDPPELIVDMYAMMDEGVDVVYGQRIRRSGESFFKKISASFYYWILGRLTKVNIPRDVGDFRLINRRVLNVLNSMPEQDRFIRGMISWVGFKQVPIRYNRHERFAGKTKYPLKKMIYFGLDGITSFSTFPLRMVTYLGFALSGLSFAVIVKTVIGYLGGATVPGWASVMVAILLIGGIQLISLGIIGQYIGKIYMQSKNRPLFVVDSVTRSGRED